MADPTDRRIEGLEIKVAYLEAQLLDLDDVLRDFADRVIALERRLQRFEGKIEERLDAVEDTTPSDPGDTGPLDPWAVD